VNISASRNTLQLQEIYDIMDVIKACASDSVSPIIGAVYEDDLAEEVRVTIVATGLGKAALRQQTKPLTVVASKTGTDNQPAEVDYGALEMPAVMRSKRNRDATIEAMRQSGVEMLDIPAFLRKQAD
jgi:cell division protein FtsZ